MVGGPADARTRRQTQKLVRTTASALKALPDSWVLLHDVRWPGRPFATLDHIAIGPSGVYVIDTEHWSGRVRLVDGVLHQDGRQRTREVLSATEATAAVCRRLPHLPADWATPVLCIVNSDVAGWAGSAAVCHRANLVEVLTSRPPVLTPEVVRSVARDLSLQLHSNTTAPPPGQRPSPAPRLSMLTRPRARPVSASRSRRKPKLAAPVAGLAFVAAVALSPPLVTGVADGVSDLFVENLDTGAKPDQPVEQQHQRQPPEDRPRR